MYLMQNTKKNTIKTQNFYISPLKIEMFSIFFGGGGGGIYFDEKIYLNIFQSMKMHVNIIEQHYPLDRLT